MPDWQIARLDRHGDGVAQSGTATARAALTLPGETIAGEATNGRIGSPRILTPSPDRVRPPCPHYRACGGCTLMHGHDDFVARWKRSVVERALSAQGLPAPIAGLHSSPPRARRRAVLSGRRTKKGALLGFHTRASNTICDLTDCHVMRPAITAALPLLRQIVAAGASRAGEVSLTVIDGPAGLDVAVRGGKSMDSGLFTRLAALTEQGDLARLDWDGQAITRRTPALPMGTARVIPPPGAFLQATAEGEAALLATIRDVTRGATRIVDLFAGIGTFTLPLASRAEMHAVEGLAAPLAAAQTAWRATPGLRRVTTETRDLARRPLLADELADYDAAVIDPPRSGAEAQARALATSNLPRIAFISCDPVSFARDARILTEGGFSLTRLFIVDQFRWSPHIEIAAAFHKR